MSTDVQATQATTTSATGSSKGSSSFGSDFETFLKMMTTQLKNQDPMDPMDSGQFALQLASFSSVEQQVKTNDLLSEIQQNLAMGQFNDLSGWIGKTIRVSGSANYIGEPMNLTFDLPTSISDARLEILDQNGAVVATRYVDLEANAFVWDGLDQNGVALSHGSYDFRIVPETGEVEGDAVAVQTQTVVSELRMENGSLFIQGEDGRLIDPDLVVGIGL
jgi:flagellar basal-body rod modification protein FlgD